MADGKGSAPNDPVLHAWTDTLARWLDDEGFFRKPVSLGRPAFPDKAAKADLAPRSAGPRLRGADGRASDALGRRERGRKRPEDARPR